MVECFTSLVQRSLINSVFFVQLQASDLLVSAEDRKGGNAINRQAILKLHRLQIRPRNKTVNLKFVALNCVFHKEHFIVVDPLHQIHNPLLPGKIYCNSVPPNE